MAILATDVLSEMATANVQHPAACRKSAGSADDDAPIST